MKLENIVRSSALCTFASAGAILLTLSYRSFSNGETFSGTTYALSSLIPFTLAVVSYRNFLYKNNSEETGVFGVPDKVIIDGWKRDSGRHKSL